MFHYYNCHHSDLFLLSAWASKTTGNIKMWYLCLLAEFPVSVHDWIGLFWVKNKISIDNFNSPSLWDLLLQPSFYLILFLRDNKKYNAHIWKGILCQIYFYSLFSGSLPWHPKLMERTWWLVWSLYGFQKCNIMKRLQKNNFSGATG